MPPTRLPPGAGQYTAGAGLSQTGRRADGPAGPAEARARYRIPRDLLHHRQHRGGERPVPVRFPGVSEPWHALLWLIGFALSRLGPMVWNRRIVFHRATLLDHVFPDSANAINTVPDVSVRVRLDAALAASNGGLLSTAPGDPRRGHQPGAVGHNGARVCERGQSLGPFCRSVLLGVSSGALRVLARACQTPVSL